MQAANFMPLMLLTIEFLLNRIKIPLRQVSFVIIGTLAYLLVTFISEKSTGFAAFSSNLNYECIDNISMLAWENTTSTDINQYTFLTDTEWKGASEIHFTCNYWKAVL